MIPRLRILVVLDTLEYVRRGGRIGRARAFLGAMLKVKPILSFRDGEVHPEERVRTKALALERLLQIATSYRIKEAGIGYSTNPQDAEDLKRRMEAMVPGVDISIVRLGPVLGVHGGPGTLGIGILERED
jgi:DegV family protein with EDD domain